MFEMGMSGISVFEMTYECSGFCTKPTMYSFRDMATYGSPKEACVKSLFNGLKSTYMGIGVVFALSTVTCLIMLMFSVFLYCHHYSSDNMGGGM